MTSFCWEIEVRMSVLCLRHAPPPPPPPHPTDQTPGLEALSNKQEDQSQQKQMTERVQSDQTFKFPQLLPHPPPPCPWPYEHRFGRPMNIFMCLSGRSTCAARGGRALCAGRLLRLWQESPTGACSPWQNAAGPVLPPSSKLPPAKQIRRHPPSPLLCRRENDRPGHCAQRPFTINSN